MPSTFFPKVEDIRRTLDDVALADAVIKCDSLYYQQSSSIDNYALLACYILFCKNEDASEGIGCRLYNMMNTFPEKWYEMQCYWKYLPDSQQIEINSFFARILLFEYFCSDGPWSKEDFYSKYPYVKLMKVVLYDMRKGEDIYDYGQRVRFRF